MTDALDGIKVIDFSTAIAGPYTARLLADFGADVIKVESIHVPDILRLSLPYKNNVAGIDRSFLFPLMNNNKYSMALNLKHPKGQEIAQRLMLWADVVIENFTPGKLAKLGLDYDKIVNEEMSRLLSECGCKCVVHSEGVDCECRYTGEDQLRCLAEKISYATSMDIRLSREKAFG